MPKMVGPFYKNGKQIGDVTSAIQMPAREVGQMGQAAALESVERYRLTVTGTVIIGMGESENIYEVTSDPDRLRVFPESSKPGRETSQVVVTLK